MINPEKIPAGKSKYEMYYSRTQKKYLCEYNYRSLWGKLFCAVAEDVETAKIRINKQLEKEGLTEQV